MQQITTFGLCLNLLALNFPSCQLNWRISTLAPVALFPRSITNNAILNFTCDTLFSYCIIILRPSWTNRSTIICSCVPNIGRLVAFLTVKISSALNTVLHARKTNRCCSSWCWVWILSSFTDCHTSF